MSSDLRRTAACFSHIGWATQSAHIAGVDKWLLEAEPNDHLAIRQPLLVPWDVFR